MAEARTLVNAREDLIICNRRAKHPVSFDAKRLGRLIGQNTADRPRVYHTLGTTARVTFLANHPVTAEGVELALNARVKKAAESGFDVLARLLSFSPAAWLEFCREKGIEAGKEQLGEALKNSQETPRRFMRMPSDLNQEVEYACDMRDYSAGLVSPYFRFEDTHRGPLFIADDDYFAEQTRNLPERYVPDVPEHWQRCLAERLNMQRIWPAMVDLAVATPQIFAYDLRQMAGTI